MLVLNILDTNTEHPVHDARPCYIVTRQTWPDSGLLCGLLWMWNLDKKKQDRMNFNSFWISKQMDPQPNEV